jgi:hypothetical protein
MINDPAIVKFSAEQMRRAANVSESDALVLETLEARYRDWGIEDRFNAMSDQEKATPIDDKAAEEGKPIYTPQMIHNFILNVRNLMASFNADLGNGWTIRRQMRYMATRPQNILLD